LSGKGIQKKNKIQIEEKLKKNTIKFKLNYSPLFYDWSTCNEYAAVISPLSFETVTWYWPWSVAKTTGISSENSVSSFVNTNRLDSRSSGLPLKIHSAIQIRTKTDWLKCISFSYQS
jgi:hypothetical protein